MISGGKTPFAVTAAAAAALFAAAAVEFFQCRKVTLLSALSLAAPLGALVGR